MSESYLPQMSGWTPLNKSSSIQHTSNHQMNEPKNYEPIDFDMPPPAPKRKRQTRRTSPKKREAKIPRLDSDLKASKAVVQVSAKTPKKAPKRALDTESRPQPETPQKAARPTEVTSSSKNKLEAFKYKGPQVRSTGRGQLSSHPQAKKRTLEDFQPACPNASPQHSDEEDFFNNLDSQEMIELEKATRKLSTEERSHDTTMVQPAPSAKRPSTTRTRTTTTDYFAGLGEDDAIFSLENLSESQLYYHGGDQGDGNPPASKKPKRDSQSQNLAPSNSQRTRTGWASPVRGITFEELQVSDLTSYPATRNFTRATESPPFRPDYPSDPERDYQVEDYFPGQGHIYSKSHRPEELAALIEEAEGWKAASEDTFADEPFTSGGFEYTTPFGHETTVEKATLKAQSSFTSLSSFITTDPPKPEPEEVIPTPKKRTRKRALITPTHYPTNPNSPIRIYCHPNSSPKPPITDYVTKKPRYNDFKIRAIDSGTETHQRLHRYLNPNEAAEKAAEAAKLKPFVRPPFPELVKDRSPVEGLVGKDGVRACFRIGEVARLINAGWDGYVEVYARVDYTFRTPLDRQIFHLHDLFHSNPPYLTAHYDLYTQAEQWDVDSAFFLTDVDSGHAHPTAPADKKIARIVGKGRKVESPGKGGKKEVEHVLDVVRIWPASEEDVTWVKRIVCGEGKKT